MTRIVHLRSAIPDPKPNRWARRITTGCVITLAVLLVAEPLIVGAVFGLALLAGGLYGLTQTMAGGDE